MARHLISDYRNTTGEHCGSTAMRNLVHHYCALELSEAEVFGLGSGIDFALLESETYEPGVMMFGRTSTMETDVADALDLDYTEQAEPDDAEAWRVVREEVLAGRPTMLSGDALYLDYRDFKVHFPAHRFVLLGFDDEAEEAVVADRIDVEQQRCSYRALAASRNPTDFLSTENLWGRFAGGRVGRELPDAFAIAVRRAALRMLGAAEVGEKVSISGTERMRSGLVALDVLAERLPEYLARPNGSTLARYAGACIESFGTGGGNFRVLYAEFLGSADERGFAGVTSADVEDCLASGRTWTALSELLRAFASGKGEGTGEGPGVGEMIAAIRSIRETETRLFERLGRAASNPA